MLTQNGVPLWKAREIQQQESSGQQDEMEEFHNLIETTSCHCHKGDKNPSLQTLAKTVGVVTDVISGPENETCICFSDPKVSPPKTSLCNKKAAREN